MGNFPKIWGKNEELSEDMKEMDRKYARKVLKVLKKKE